MRAARDTFLTFLTTNGFDVHNLRKDTNFPDNNHLKMNAVNVQFLTDKAQVCISNLTVTVDVVYDNELDAVDAAAQLQNLLSQSGLTPLLDYSNRGSDPVPLGSFLYWDPTLVQFRPIYGDSYCRRSALLTLSYHIY